ncbi:MAG TPA: cation-translocating P-type ATPase [Bacillota bacterium]|nr:cation-translocating P-type ATPase [Bacillota bacterium]
MKKIDHLVDRAVKERSQEYISNVDKKKFGNEILSSAGALSFLVAGLIYGRFCPEQDVVAGLIYLSGTLIVGIPIIFTAVKGFYKKEITSAMEILVSIAMIICVLDNQFLLAILIPIILNLVHFLEEKSILGGQDAIEGLKKMQSSTAFLFDEGKEREVDAKDLISGDLIIVKPGMSLPIDGTVVKGSSSIDQKSLTGESLPKGVSKGDKVFAGTVNMDGELMVLVEKPYVDTSFQKIVKLLEEAEKIKIPEIQIIDRFMMYYIPLVLIVAFFAWIFSQDITRAVAVLVVSCPCGLMLVNSAPVIASLAAAAKRGVLIKNSKFIEKLSDVDYVIFDKTGTVTNGTLEASNYYLDQAESYEKLISTAAAVSRSSLHPVSKSMLLLSRDIEFDSGYEVKEYVGQGLIGKKGDSEIIVGNSRWVGGMGYEVTDRYDEDGSASWVVRDGQVLGCVLFRDIPREGARSMVGRMRRIGITGSCILTGDNITAAERIKKAVGIDEMYCSLLPEQKLEKVRELNQVYTTAFVGDGINDALALSEADIGIAMGAMGSDTAIQSADISLMNNDLDNIPFAVELARKTKRIIYQNMIIAFLISFVMIFLAAGGIIGAIFGAFLHNIGALIVLCNSGRILK